jgi:uncharacterized membrane-anchored protein
VAFARIGIRIFMAFDQKLKLLFSNALHQLITFYDRRPFCAIIVGLLTLIGIGAIVGVYLFIFWTYVFKGKSGVLKIESRLYL